VDFQVRFKKLVAPGLVASPVNTNEVPLLVVLYVQLAAVRVGNALSDVMGKMNVRGLNDQGWTVGFHFHDPMERMEGLFLRLAIASQFK